MSTNNPDHSLHVVGKLEEIGFQIAPVAFLLYKGVPLMVVPIGFGDAHDLVRHTMYELKMLSFLFRVHP